MGRASRIGNRAILTVAGSFWEPHPTIKNRTGRIMIIHLMEMESLINLLIDLKPNIFIFPPNIDKGFGSKTFFDAVSLTCSS
jgi:hypothetical protein